MTELTTKSRRSGTEIRQRQHTVGVRLTNTEHDYLIDLARLAGVTVPELIRHTLLASDGPVVHGKPQVTDSVESRNWYVDRLFDEKPSDWWRYVGCSHCRAMPGEVCQATWGRALKPHAARVRTARALHGTLWLLREGFEQRVLGEPVAERAS